MATYHYQCEARSVEAFVAQLVRYVSSGHYFYITATIPDGKDRRAVDSKLIERYSIARPKWKRQRRNLRENAGIHYLRHGAFFVICLTKGRHETFYGDHAGQLRDIRRNALRFGGYSIRYSYSSFHKRWKVHVRLDKEVYRTVKAHLLELAARPNYRDARELEAEFGRLPYEGYDPIRQQLLTIARAVNRQRRRSGYARVDVKCILQRRVRVTRVFREGENDQSVPPPVESQAA